LNDEGIIEKEAGLFTLVDTSTLEREKQKKLVEMLRYPTL